MKELPKLLTAVFFLVITVSMFEQFRPLEQFKERIVQNVGSLARRMRLQRPESNVDQEPILNLAHLVSLTPTSMRNLADILDQDPMYQQIQRQLSSSVPLRATTWNNLLEARARRVHTLFTNPDNS
jgi:hypothetical protein